VSRPLTACADTGNASAAHTITATIFVHAGARTRASVQPSAPAAAIHDAAPITCARRRTSPAAAAPPLVNGAITTGHGSGVTPSVGGPAPLAVKRHPIPA